MCVCVCCGCVLTSSLRLLTRSTPPGPECPDNATLPAAAAAAAAALRGLMAPKERGGERKDRVSSHSPEEPTAQHLRRICPVAMHSTCLHPPHQAHPVTQPTPHTSGKPTSQSQYLPLGRSLSEPISHRLVL